MSSTIHDTRKVLVGLMLTDGTEHAVFSFPTGKPTHATLTIIVSLMADGWRLAKAETVPVNDLKK